MARVLIVYHRHPRGQWRSTYESHLTSFRRFTGHDCYYLNTAWLKVPGYLKRLEPDLVIFHYTFLAVRQVPEEFERQQRQIDFIKAFPCPKAIVPHDEQAHADLLCQLVRDFGVTHVFTPAPESEWRAIYSQTDFERLTFRTVLTGYVDDEAVARYAGRARETRERPIDVGYRSWDAWPFYGRHGLLKGEVGRAVKSNAARFGLNADISDDYRDAFLGDSWFEFLLKCKYTLGVEGGSSVLDFDGTIAQRTRAYLSEHPGAPFDEVETACFPGEDGRFRYFLLGPRHLEAVITRTCQVLVEGTYGGALEAGKHYIPLKRDFSNLDEALVAMQRDDLRAEMVERAYEDVVASGKWTYRAFANLVLDVSLGGMGAGAVPARMRGERWLLAWNRLGGDRVLQSLHPKSIARSVRESLADGAVRLFGEERVWRALVRAHNLVRRARRREPLSLEYVPTPAEQARRDRLARERRG